jgi:phosphoribosyl-AMP cyclohydrolase
MTRVYYAKNRAIPFKAKVEVVKFYPRRRAVVRYKGIEYGTLTQLLRKEPA